MTRKIVKRSTFLPRTNAPRSELHRPGDGGAWKRCHRNMFPKLPTTTAFASALPVPISTVEAAFVGRQETWAMCCHNAGYTPLKEGYSSGYAWSYRQSSKLPCPRMAELTEEDTLGRYGWRRFQAPVLTRMLSLWVASETFWAIPKHLPPLPRWPAVGQLSAGIASRPFG